MDEQRQLILDQFTRQAAPFSEMHARDDAGMLRLLIETADIGGDDEVLDVACGPGLVACEVAKVARHVTGVDLTGLLLGCGLNAVALQEGVFGIRQGGTAAAALDLGEIGSDPGAVLKGGLILQMKMEVGLARIAAVAAEGEHLAAPDLVAAVDAQGVGLEMCVYGVFVGALVNDQAISDGEQRVHGAWLVIGDAVDRGDDGAGGRGQDFLSVNKVIFVSAADTLVREVVGTFDNQIGGAALASARRRGS